MATNDDRNNFVSYLGDWCLCVSPDGTGGRFLPDDGNWETSSKPNPDPYPEDGEVFPGYGNPRRLVAVMHFREYPLASAVHKTRDRELAMR